MFEIQFRFGVTVYSSSIGGRKGIIGLMNGLGKLALNFRIFFVFSSFDVSAMSGGYYLNTVATRLLFNVQLQSIGGTTVIGSSTARAIDPAFSGAIYQQTKG